MRQLFYRNAHARDHLEVFLVTAISSLLLLRFYLFITGYPQIGGDTLHIAHMLYGGLLLMAAVVINLSFLGIRSERVAAVVGGIGFGVFIDELGKFITKDNDYFFQPTVGLIYATFCVLFLTFNFLSRQEKLTSEEYQLNALREFEEAVIHDMDRKEKAAMRSFLAKANPDKVITKELKELLKHVHAVPPGNSLPIRIRHKVTEGYKYFWHGRASKPLVIFVIAVPAFVLVMSVLIAVYNNFSSIQALFRGSDSYVSTLIMGQLVSSVVAASFVVIGAFRLPQSRARALEWFRRAVLVNIFLTEFFIFSRIEFGAIQGFIINVILLIMLHFAIEQERRVKAQA